MCVLRRRRRSGSYSRSSSRRATRSRRRSASGTTCRRAARPRPATACALQKPPPYSFSYQDHHMCMCLSRRDRPSVRTRITTCVCSCRGETGPQFVPGSPRVVAHLYNINGRPRSSAPGARRRSSRSSRCSDPWARAAATSCRPASARCAHMRTRMHDVSMRMRTEMRSLCSPVGAEPEGYGGAGFAGRGGGADRGAARGAAGAQGGDQRGAPQPLAGRVAQRRGGERPLCFACRPLTQRSRVLTLRS